MGGITALTSAERRHRPLRANAPTAEGTTRWLLLARCATGLGSDLGSIPSDVQTARLDNGAMSLLLVSSL